jgi:hypothetical protein
MKHMAQFEDFGVVDGRGFYYTIRSDLTLNKYQVSKKIMFGDGA